MRAPLVESTEVLYSLLVTVGPVAAALSATLFRIKVDLAVTVKIVS